MIRSYRDLKVWQLAMDLAESAYRQSQDMPRAELYGMVSQIRRSAVSVPANIAEGYGRGSRKSYLQFLKIARGSLRELETHILLAQRVGLSNDLDANSILASADTVARMLGALIKSIEASSGAASRLTSI
jgi:four helix bundle protein